MIIDNCFLSLLLFTVIIMTESYNYMRNVNRKGAKSYIS